jgi:hypothetical protein
MSTLVDLNNLPKIILDKIPLSIRAANKKVELEELPLSIQYMINDYIIVENDEIYTNPEFYDVHPEITHYNDCKILSNRKEIAKSYLFNYFSTKKGHYPFDPEFGNNLHLHLQTKDTSLRKTLISNELSDIIRLVNSSFSFNISVIESGIYSTDIGGGIEYFLNLKIKIEDEVIQLSV